MVQKHSESESQFNMGLAYLKRIDLIFHICWKSSQLHDVNNWLGALRALERELCVKMNEGEIEKVEEKFKEINSIINDGKTNSQRNKLCALLHKLEIKLRKTAQDKGMLLPAKRDISKAALDY